MSEKLEKGLLELEQSSSVLTNDDAVTEDAARNLGESLSPAMWEATDAIFVGTSVLIFGLIVFGTMAYLLTRKHSADDVIKICALPLIIISAILLVVLGYSQNQIGPAMALLSAIAGYLLGNKQYQKPEVDPNPTPKKKTAA